MINVTKPFLPPIEEYYSLIKDIWERNWLTNNGPIINELELKLKEYLKVPHVLVLGNGTIALQIAIKSLDLKGEIITTPFSYIASTSSIAWENCKPVFVDIEEDSLNINPELIEKAITEKTSAILATHVFGNPCNIHKIQNIAKKNNLNVIYDASHCFGVTYENESVFLFGDISTTSFHSTKLFHTVEGGAVFSTDPDLIKKMSYMRNFGHKSYDEFECVGLNGKNSELHAAMGLINLKYIDDILNARKEQHELYNSALEPLKVKRQAINKNCKWNFSYYPVIFNSEELLLKSLKDLNENWIYPRRYFYPSLSSLNYVEKYEVPVCDSVSKRIMCLPLYHNLKKQDIDFISRILLRTQNY